MKRNVKQQEDMFVRWSKRITAKHYDIDFIIEKLKRSEKQNIRILDIGGGVGSVAKAISENVDGAVIDVIDFSPLAEDNFVQGKKINFITGNFLTYQFKNKYDAIIMRVLLHHLIDCNENKTSKAQNNGLKKAKELLKPNGVLFVTENYYEPYLFKDLSGRLIYEVTKLKSIAGFVRIMGANTAGEGVRFRSWKAWEDFFHSNGLIVVEARKSTTWGKSISIWKKIFLFCREAFQAVVMLRVKNS